MMGPTIRFRLRNLFEGLKFIGVAQSLAGAHILMWLQFKSVGCILMWLNCQVSLAMRQVNGLCSYVRME